MKVKSMRAWQTFLHEVHRGLEALGIDRDYFNVDDLLHLHKTGYSAQRVVDLALAKRPQEAAQ